MLIITPLAVHTGFVYGGKNLLKSQVQNEILSELEKMQAVIVKMVKMKTMNCHV